MTSIQVCDGNGSLLTSQKGNTHDILSRDDKYVKPTVYVAWWHITVNRESYEGVSVDLCDECFNAVIDLFTKKRGLKKGEGFSVYLY